MPQKLHEQDGYFYKYTVMFRLIDPSLRPMGCMPLIIILCRWDFYVSGTQETEVKQNHCTYETSLVVLPKMCDEFLIGLAQFTDYTYKCWS